MIGGYGEEDGVGAAVAGGAPGCRGITGAGATAMAPSSAADEATDEGVVVIRAPVIRPQWAMKSRRPAATGRRTVVDGRRRARMRGRPQTGGGARERRAGGRERRCANDARAATDGGALTGAARRARISADSRGRGRDGRGWIHRDGGWTPLRTGQPYPRRPGTPPTRICAAEEGGNRRRQTGGDGSMTGRACCFPPTSGIMAAANVGAGVSGGIIGGAPGGDGAGATDASGEGAAGCSTG